MKEKKLDITYFIVGILIGLFALRNIFVVPTSYIGTEDTLRAGLYIALPMILAIWFMYTGITTGPPAVKK